MAEKCTNTSSPVERWMNPYPFAPLNHFTVPFSLTKNSFRLIAKNYSSVALLFALAWKRGHPLKGTVRTWVASPHAEKPRQQKRLLRSVDSCPRRNTVEPRKRRRDIRTADTETSNPLTRQPGPADEAPDNSRKIPVGKS